MTVLRLKAGPSTLITPCSMRVSTGVTNQELLEAVQRHMETVRLPGTVQEEERCQEKTVVFKPPMVGERLS